MRIVLPTLLLAAAMLPATAAPPPALAPGKTLHASLQSSDRPSDRGGRSHDYRLRLGEGQTVLITAKSDAFDAELLVFDPDGTLVAENDDHERGSTNAAVVLAVPQDGEYTVRVNSLPLGEAHTGAYAVRALVFDGD